MELLKIGIVGFSGAPFDHQKGKVLLEESIDFFCKKFSPQKVEIVSGLTNVGIPKLAYEIAVQKGFVTVGISAEQALQVKCGVFPVDKKTIVGTKFGDESQTFLDYIDCLIRIGGGKQSHKETALFKEHHRNWQDIVVEKEIQ